MQYNWTAPDGSNVVIEGSGSSEELLQLRTQWEERLAKGAGGKPSFEVMSPMGEREVLESAARGTEAQLGAARSALESKRQDFAGAISGGLAAGGGMASAARVGTMLAPLGPEVALPAAALAGLGGSALGAGAGQYGGAKLMGTEQSEDKQRLAALDAAEKDILIGGAFTGAGAAARGLKPWVREATTKMFGLDSPEVIERVGRDRALGLRTTVADIYPRLADMYGKLWSVVPAVSQPLRQAKARRDLEVNSIMEGLTGPLESGLNTVAISKNFLKSAANARTIRQNWYTRIYGEGEAYFAAHPNIRIDNDAITSAQKHYFEQSKRSRPVFGPNPAPTGPPVVEHYRTAGFKTPAQVDVLIDETMRGPQQLDYAQYTGLSQDITRAIRSGAADPEQRRTLVQMKENLDSALERTNDPAAIQLVRRSRHTYQQVMDFFENPQAFKFEAAQPGIFSNVKEVTKGHETVERVVDDKLFDTLMQDLTPTGVRNMAKFVGADNMTDATERYVGQGFLKNTNPTTGDVDWQGVRKSFGIDVPGSVKSLGTEEMLHSGQHRLAGGGLSRMVDAMERSIGPKLPPIATMFVRQQAFGGPAGAIRGLLATKALKVLGDPVTSVGALFAFRRFSQFLGDPNRLNAVMTVMDPLIKSAGAKETAGRQIMRWLAQDLAEAESPGVPPSAGMTDQTESRLYQAVNFAYKTGSLANEFAEEAPQAANQMGLAVNRKLRGY